MILASHYVIRDLMNTIEYGEPEDIRKIFKKYCSRYKNDHELVKVCDIMPVNLEEISDTKVEEIKSKLRELSETRILESSGGTRLWFSDRRKI